MNILRKIEKRFFDKTLCASYLEKILLNQAAIISFLNSQNKKNIVGSYFSQWNEDGIIQILIQKLQIKNKRFIEIGVGDFFESNCRLILQKDNWEGYIFEASKQYSNIIKNSNFFWKYNLNHTCVFVSKRNINKLISPIVKYQDIGIFSLDIDGNDFHVLKAIDKLKFEVIVVEFNPRFNSVLPLSVPYNESFSRSKKNNEVIYYGANLMAFKIYLEEKGFRLLCVNSHNSNAFFVQENSYKKIRHLFPRPKKLTPIFDEACAKNKTKISNREMLRTLKDKPLENTQSGEILSISKLLKTNFFS